jgi:hypothetical protein
MIEHNGTFNELIDRVEKLGFEADAESVRPIANGGQQFRTTKGAVVCWWPSTGTVTFQGNVIEAKRIRNALRPSQRGLFDVY